LSRALGPAKENNYALEPLDGHIVQGCSGAKTEIPDEVDCIHLPDTGLDIKDVFPALKAQRLSLTKSIPQRKLQENVPNCKFVQWDDSLVRFYESYKQKSVSIDIYYDHKKAEEEFGTRFYFDKGLVFSKDRIRDDEDGDFLLIRNSNTYHPECRGQSIDKQFIRLPDGAQGLGVFDLQYKIVWSYMNPYFLFEVGLIRRMIDPTPVFMRL
jgi:hypothetical protein